MAERLANEDDQFGPDDALVIALTTIYFRALGLADSALVTGEPARFEAAISAITELIKAAGDIGNLPTWWAATLTSHLLRDLWDESLHNQIPRDAGPSGNLSNRWEGLRQCGRACSPSWLH